MFAKSATCFCILIGLGKGCEKSKMEKDGEREGIYLCTRGRNLMMAKEENEMRSMMERLENYLNKKRLILNTKETNI